MQPVFLSVVRGKNFLLGTYDTGNFQRWWKSEPFPGEVDEIQQPVHVYGQYHICICKMLDGTYSIYRTTNMGKSWTQVYNTDDIIYTLALIDHGWVIGSTSTGWIESKADSGKTWDKISSFAPGCRTVINIGDDILFAHDTNFVWKSEDYAKTWRQVLNVHDFKWISSHSADTGGRHYKYRTIFPGYVPPALCGYGSRVIVGCGCYLLISDDYGKNWTMPAIISPDHPVWFDILDDCGIGWAYPWCNIRILQLVVTDLVGNKPTDVVVTARVRVIDRGIVRYTYCVDKKNMNIWRTLFDAKYIDDSNGAISTYGVMHVGTSGAEILSVVNYLDSKSRPITKISKNGINWYTIDAQKVVVYDYDGNTLSNIGQQVYDEEYLTYFTWTGDPCHNEGRWVIEHNKAVRGLSWDQDLLVLFRQKLAKPISFACDVLATETESAIFDALCKKAIPKSSTYTIPIEKNNAKTYLISQMLRDTFTKEIKNYLAIAERTSAQLSLSMYNNKTMASFSHHDVCLFTAPENAYNCDIRLIDDHMEEITNSIERYTPQIVDIEYLDIPYKPYDSRTQKVVP